LINILRIKYKAVFPLLIFLMSLYIVEILLIWVCLFPSANILFLLTQLIIVPISSFIIVYLFNDLLGERNTLFLHTYYKQKFIKIYILNIFIFAMPMLLVTIILAIQYSDFNGSAAFFLLFTELFLFSSLSLLLFVFIGDFSFIVTVFTLYISVELATFGTYKNLYHIFIMSLHNNIDFTTTVNTTIFNLILGILSCRILKISIS